MKRAYRIQVDKWQRKRREKGNIAVIVAVSLTVLIGMLALVVDGGYLYGAKNRYQNGVEAAALAGAHHFADGYDGDGLPLALGIAEGVAAENGIPSGAVAAEVGFYDEAAAHFEPDLDPTTDWNEAISTEEAPILNNAVKVTAQDSISTFFSGILGRETVTVSTGAVAYGKRYTFLATATEGETGIDVDSRWRTGFPVYRNCIFGSNGPVLFAGEAYETFQGTWVESMGGVTGAEGKVEVIELTKPLERKAIDWDSLHAQAEANGVVYTHADLESWPSEWATDALGNSYKRVENDNPYGDADINYFFLPAGRDDSDPTNPAYQGDHGGRTYYFEVPDEAPPEFPGGYILRVWNSAPSPAYVVPPGKRTCWNFTIAAPCRFCTYPLPASASYTRITTTLGNVPEYGDEGLVYIYAKDCTGYSSNWYTRYAGIKLCEPNGVIFHGEGRFQMYTQNAYDTIYYLRVYADSINIYDPYTGRNVYDGAFGPLDNVKLGRLE